MMTFLVPLAIHFLQILMKILYYVILVQVLLSWFPAARRRYGAILEPIVEPILRPFRWARIGMLDLSPILALIALDYGARLLLEFLVQFL